MVENVNSKKLVGNICLHQSLVPERLFLRRNLRHILDSHERQLGSITNVNSHEDMIANEQRISGWDFPTREMLKDLTKGERPVLQLDSLQIRHPKSKAIIPTRLRNQTNGDEEFSWPPDPNAELRLPCRVEIIVRDTRGAGTFKRLPDVYQAEGTIVQNRSNEISSTFNIELKRPTLVDLDKFFVVEETGRHDQKGYKWKRTTTAKYGLEIRIYCQNLADAAKLYSQLESRTVAEFANLLPNEAILKAIWDGLPQCPSDDDLLALTHPRGHKKIELDYKLELSMGWARKRESPLQKFNQKVLEAQKGSRQLPTPSASDDMEIQHPKKYVMYYVYVDGFITKARAVEGLSCPFCRLNSDRREHTSLDRLRLHFLTYHNHFKFDLEEPEEEESSSVIRRTLYISVAPEEAIENVDDPHNKYETVYLNHVAPYRPLNVNGYVNGKDRWGRSGKTRSGTRKGRSTRDRDRDYMTVPSPQPIRKRPALDEVEDLLEHRPRKHQVPNVPGVSFYHTTSKQVLKPGEYVADSDEYVDESWLAQNQTFGLEELGITGAAQEFTIAFNQHLAREQSDSSILTREALVRFARIHQQQSLSIEWQRQFRAKLNQLHEAGIIDLDIVSYCVRRLKAQSEANMTDAEADSVAGSDKDGLRTKAGPVNGGMLQRSRKKWAGDKIISREPVGSSKGKARIIDSDDAGDCDTMDWTNTNRVQSSKAARLTGADKSNACICGTAANLARASIACKNPVSLPLMSTLCIETDASQRCARGDYHLSCVNLERRLPGWRCDDCVD